MCAFRSVASVSPGLQVRSSPGPPPEVDAGCFAPRLRCGPVPWLVGQRGRAIRFDPSPGHHRDSALAASRRAPGVPRAARPRFDRDLLPLWVTHTLLQFRWGVCLDSQFPGGPSSRSLAPSSVRGDFTCVLKRAGTQGLPRGRSIQSDSLPSPGGPLGSPLLIPPGQGLFRARGSLAEPRTPVRLLLAGPGAVKSGSAASRQPGCTRSRSLGRGRVGQAALRAAPLLKAHRWPEGPRSQLRVLIPSPAERTVHSVSPALSGRTRSPGTRQTDHPLVGTSSRGRIVVPGSH